MFNQELRRQALRTARDTLSRISDRKEACRLCRVLPGPPGLRRNRSWKRHDLACGDAGHALAYGHVHRIWPHEGWEKLTDRYLQEAIKGIKKSSAAPLGLFEGITAVTFALRYSVRPQYQKNLAALEERLFTETRAWLSTLPRRGGVAVHEYDVISGLSGIGRYLLEASGESATAEKLLRKVLRVFIDWTSIEKTTGFYTPREFVSGFEVVHKPDLAGGYVNCGLAHGVPGPLALMALSHRKGLEVDGLPEAIDKLSRWLIARFRETRWGPDVPYYLPLVPEDSKDLPSRTAWCYGNAGVARALQLAGVALKDSEFRLHSLDLMHSIIRRPARARKAPAATLCHGLAGLLQVTLRYLQDGQYSEQPDPSLFRFANRTLRSILNQFDESSSTGFRNFEPGTGWVADPGFLEGSTGVALVLLGSCSETESDWDQVLLLS